MLESVISELDNCDVAAQRLLNSLGTAASSPVGQQIKAAQESFRTARQLVVDAVARATANQAGTNEQSIAATPGQNRPGSPVQPAFQSGTRTEIEGQTAGVSKERLQQVEAEIKNEPKVLHHEELGGLGATVETAIGGGGGQGGGDEPGRNKDGSVDKRTVKGPDRRMGEKVPDQA